MAAVCAATAETVLRRAVTHGSGAGGAVDVSKSLADRVVVVTGASSGVGLESARVFAEAGATVVMAVRDVAKGKAVAKAFGAQAEARCRVMALDLCSLQSVRDFAKELIATGLPIHVLMLNAGCFPLSRRITQDGFEETFQANYLGHYLLARLLEDKVAASAPSRIVIVSSYMHTMGKVHFPKSDARKGYLADEDESYSAAAAYAQAKLCEILMGKTLHDRLHSKNVAVFSVHPGGVATSIYPKWTAPITKLFMATPAQGASVQVHAALFPPLQSHGYEYFHPGSFGASPHAVKLARHASDDAVAKRLWDESERLVRL